ncbi:hypothetical protein SM124_13585 [Bacillus sp. 31A1R]|uniref:Uncharacterized protein n=1 Tax=Robertmurraya mangrovi TaxID=3098077 RepID=A0ABU5J022_9BACI|nr:hypothetical protein [Bacillus sp. 31A1R]MDZ5472759.1 hypothetical protein [Bacillus sp. 31A1R]
MSGWRIQSQFLGAGLANNRDVGDDTKLTEDRYELYVNNEFVGYKTLLNQSDNLKDVNDFLQRQGFQQFTSDLEGDHYNISTESDLVQPIKDALGVYCSNR